LMLLVTKWVRYLVINNCHWIPELVTQPRLADIVKLTKAS
jgi:hypothetical protein